MCYVNLYSYNIRRIKITLFFYIYLFDSVIETHRFRPALAQDF